MTDEPRSNLEPIEEGDLDLESKFQKGKGENAELSGKETPEMTRETTPAPEKAAERSSEVSSAEKDQSYQRILQKAGVSTQKAASEEEVKKDAQGVVYLQDEQQKIDQLVNLALTKGVAHAVKVAKHMEDYYALDEFHDRLLADELHNALVEKGLLKEI